jgi:hypothetical protein
LTDRQSPFNFDFDFESPENHVNEHVRSIGKSEAKHRKYKRLKLGSGQAYYRSSD